MQSQHHPSPQRRISSAHSHNPTSSSSVAAPDSAQHTETQHQYEAKDSIQTQSSQRHDSAQASSSAAASQLTKLDGVVYHFYTTTANLVIQSRLAHLRSALLTAPFDTDPRPASSTATTSQTKLSRWFGLQIPDSDLFREELRLWRSVTSMLGLDALDEDALQNLAPQPSIPHLIIDVMLDLSNVSDHHDILLLTNSSTGTSTRSRTTTSQLTETNSSRYCIDGRRPAEAPSAQRQSIPRRIVLERWRLQFHTYSPSNPSDLSTFYKRSIAHFRVLFDLLTLLPSNRLAAKIQALKSVPEMHSDASPQSLPSLSARKDTGSHDAEMTLGCRLSMALEHEPTQAATPGEIDVTQALPAEQGLEFAVADGASLPESGQSGQSGQSRSHGHYATHTFAPVASPIGHLETSVTYRRLTEFSVEDSESLRGANDIKIDLDEDYFRSPQLASAAPPKRSDRTEAPSSQSQTAVPASLDVDTAQNRDRQISTTHFPVLSQQRIGGISAARPATLAAHRSSPDSFQASTEENMPQSPANASVFSTSASGRQTAGLSSLRRTASNKSSLSLMGPANASGAPSSPALAAALSADPAFVIPSSVRRPSTSERRLRTISGLSSGRPSPPISPATATFELPEKGTSLPRSTSAAFSTSLADRSISTRTTSGFAAAAAPSSMGPPAQPRLSVSFSPSSPSPLAQQMPPQGSRGGPALAPNVSQSTSSFRSGSGSGLKSSMAGTGVLTTPSLRSVFQNYVYRSQNASTAPISRTPPTSTNVFAHGSYSPSSLGTGFRSSIRRNSSTNEAGSGYAFGASLTSSPAAAAAAAKPQMIKRYSTNFSYRQNRDRAGIYGSSLGSEASSSLGAGGEPSSYPRFGEAGGSLSSAYGRSWISRMEQRQGLGTGGAFARTSSLDDATAAATASAASRYRPISVTQTGGLTPSPRSHEEEIDDLARLLEARPAFSTSSKLISLRNERRNAPGLSSTPEEVGFARQGTKPGALTESVQSNVGQDRSSSLAGSGFRSGGIRTNNPMSRSQLDDLLSRMAESVGILGSKEQGSSASGETWSDVAASNDARVQTPLISTAARATQMAPISQALTQAQVAASVGKGRGGSAYKEGDLTADIPSSRLSSPGALNRALSGETGLRSRSAVGHQVRAYGTTSTRPVGGSVGADRAGPTSIVVAGPATSSTAALNPNRLVDYEAEGDLMFKVDGQAEYDLEDALPGEMEIEATARTADGLAASFGGGVEGGMGATLPVGAYREARPHHDWHGAARWERERALKAERRRADAEMSRNFGQEVGASTRGRGASPWRTTTHSPTATATVTATAASGGIGFRSSSSTANRLMGAGLSLGGGANGGDGGDGRRGYGVSAPSTQFHYHGHAPAQGQAQTASGTQSYPVSRDELYEDGDNAEEG
ncbi:uncharacterized protein MEPE_03299 [Melanopsichium pennsylvanicum]|uniref:Autophagy-related protein 13 n=2 Tax=Melanopsichium pennsylvanicum TaxID=63383 RepID=A0AAJ4XL54_9BASI|nr:conserved hypothetical protein [Melanopsichium pennsylvanicum 4]SNX84590.1 uncharacterized protein MEPE_03299 [Melanopsichium pennsylvanicum]